jgi:hypothetical protein
MPREEIEAWLNLHDRSRFAGLLFEGRGGEAWSVRTYQRESLESWASRKVHCDGRDVGKTTEIELTALWASVACPNREMLIATQTENHLYPLMHRIASRIESTPYLKNGVAELRRTPSWHIRFKNGFVLWGRIAGPRGMNFQGMHVDWQVVDEAQEMTDASWGELFQALNGGGRRWVYGVPNGLRNMFHRMTGDPEIEQYNWPSHLNPEFDAAKDAELARLYGGKGSPGYIHRVLGQHGQPAHGVFDLDAYAACIRDEIDYVEDRLGEDDAFEAPMGILPGTYYLGCDLGYARDPSEFVVYQAEGPYLVHVHRVHLDGVNYARQEDVIVDLDRAYAFDGIGIDAGNNGRAVAHRLMSRGVDWCEKVRSIEFGSSVPMEPLPDGQVVRRPVKEFMTELVQQRLGERTLVLPRCTEREAQYAGHTYRIGTGGRIVYDKGNDHIIDADRCALLRHYMDTQQEDWVDLGIRVSGF